MAEEYPLGLPLAAGRSRPLRFAPGLARVCAQLLLCLLSMTLALWLVLPHLSAVEHLADGHGGSNYLPWVIWDSSRGNRLDVDLRVTPLTPKIWNLTVEGRLEDFRINGRPVPLAPPGSAAAGWRDGVDLDYSPWLQRGDNHLTFVVDSEAVVGGLSFRPLIGWRVLILWAGFLPWLLVLCRWFRLRRPQVLVLVIALQVLCLYWAQTPWNLRAHDLMRNGGHEGYVSYVAAHLALPPPDQGWTYFHPPLYYILGAAAWRGAQWLGLPGPDVLQGLSLALWLIFLTASVATLRLTLRRSPDVLLAATAALALWPSGVISSICVGNDTALYAAAALATFFLVRWWRSGRRRHLLGAAAFTALALLCKSNAVVLAAALCGLLGLRLLLRRRRARRTLADTGLAAAVIAGGMLLSFASRLYYYWRGDLDNWLIANSGRLPENLHVPVRLANFLPLQLPQYLTTPWLDAYHELGGRSNFWNYLLRSSLTGEYDFPGAPREIIACVWGVVLLALAVSLLIPARRGAWPGARWRDAPLLLLGLLWLASLLSLRLGFPYACSNDFRYILPALIPFTVAAARKGQAACAGLMAIALGSALFFMLP